MNPYFYGCDHSRRVLDCRYCATPRSSAHDRSADLEPLRLHAKRPSRGCASRSLPPSCQVTGMRDLPASLICVHSPLHLSHPMRDSRYRRCTEPASSFRRAEISTLGGIELRRVSDAKPCENNHNGMNPESNASWLQASANNARSFARYWVPICRPYDRLPADATGTESGHLAGFFAGLSRLYDWYIVIVRDSCMRVTTGPTCSRWAPLEKQDGHTR